MNAMDPRRMASSDGRRTNRPYRKASEYLATKQGIYDGPRTMSVLEHENTELREKLTTSVRRMETLEVEFEQSREYFSTQLDVTTDKLNRTAQALKVMQQSYSELQSINYELEQRVLKVNQLESDRAQLTSDVHELTNKLTETRSSLQKMQKENERLRKDCNLAVSLLECNSGNFKQQKFDQLPRDFQNRVEEYQIDLSQYNEYINPYAADSDSEGEMPPTRPYKETAKMITSDLLANVLKKPENVHLNLEETDFIRDPDLNSVYKGQIAEKKLIKYDYKDSPGGENHAAALTSSNKIRDQRGHFQGMTKSSSGVQSSGQSSSPWELAPTTVSSASSSPWEMSSNPPTQNDDDLEDYSAASAYGAYPVSYRNPKPRSKPAPTRYNPPPYNGLGESVKKSVYSKSKMSSSYHVATSPGLRKSSQKGKGQNNDVYISETFKQQEEVTKEQVAKTTGSGQSSRKSTPGKVTTDNEKGSKSEKSSLLDQEGDDEEEMIMTIELGGKGPPKVGMAASSGDYRRSEVEGRGLLRQDSDPEPDERELDHESDDEKANYVDECDLKEEAEKGDKPVNHALPELNLLNLEDNAEVLPHSSLIDQFVMQQTILNEVIGPTSLLPDLPPPSEQSHNGESILCEELPPPPPPDMFGGAPMPEIPIFSRSNVENQVAVTLTAETHSVTSQTVSSIDDLKTCVQKEFEMAKCLSTPHHPTQKDEPTPGSVQKDTGTNGNAEYKYEEDSSDVVLAASSRQVLEEDLDAGTDGEILMNPTNNEEEPRNDENFSENPSNTEKTSELTEESSIPRQSGRGALDAEYLESQYDEKLGSEGNGSFGTSEPYAAETSDGEVIITALSQEQQENVQSETLEVVELQEEPRGGSYNRRRRNSFDQAREFGSVMDS